ncbi:P-loop containing nucleoside triphosphate hydrolase protein [Chaetomidium leptoderma]|uniref:P-loop containing nucleoside triphosphate hydrolase protein n=1 Tax=Chaetomidium leptoderma TaxID=669021 RepID=A0AAN6VMH1_9PEZI|nr:P-loop containing nucleoside triphosphate hydrolase protein [Chaetomidium leptoderma]
MPQQNAVDHASPAQKQKSSPPVDTSVTGVTPRPDPSLDVLTPLLESLMIGSSAPSTSTTAEPKSGPGLAPKSQVKSELKPKAQLKQKLDPTPQQKRDGSRCARCDLLLRGSGRVRYQTPCCRTSICGPCIMEGLTERLRNDLWQNLGSLQWVGCVANSCQILRALQDLNILNVDAGLKPDILPEPVLKVAQRARDILDSIRPRPTRREWELAQRLHKALTDHKLMSTWSKVDLEAVAAISAPLFPVRSGFLTQPVPILTGMLKTESRTCTSCSAAFQAVDTSNETAWTYVSTTFPGDWTWMVLGRPSKTILPEWSSNKLKPLGGGLPNPKDSESSSHKEALMSAIVSKKPNVRWDDVAGLTPAKHELQRAIVFPARFPNLYDEKRKASGAILLYGPPGTGKSYLAKAVATEVDHTLFSISSGDVVSKWVGESEKLVRQLFTLARENKPSIIFIDEIDALCSNREGGGGGGGGGGSADRGSEHSSRMKTEILVQLDGLHAGSSDNTGVVVLAATNLPWALDPAFRRRFEPRIYIPLPDREARRQLFGIHSGKWGEILSGGDMDELAAMTEGYSGSDIANVIKHALSVPLQTVQRARFFRVTPKSSGGEEDLYTPCESHEEGAVEMTWEKVPKNRLWDPPVTAADFKQVLRDRRVKSSVGAGELQRYEDWTHEFGVEGSR